MAVRVYTGKLSDYSRAAFPAAETVKCWVEPVSAGFAATGLMAKRRIPITVSADGSFTVSLEASSEVRPKAVYVIHARWQSGDDIVGRSQWRFIAPNRSGDLGLIAAINLGIDTDGVPFFDPGNWGNQLHLDTDGVPYFTIGE